MFFSFLCTFPSFNNARATGPTLEDSKTALRVAPHILLKCGNLIPLCPDERDKSTSLEHFEDRVAILLADQL